jgi:hypothetical protein
MSDSRDTKIRKAAVIDSSSLTIPFAYIQKQFGYSVDSILRPIHNQPVIDMGTYPDTFPYTISEYYWVYSDNTHIDTWMTMGKLISGQYFLYSAEAKIKPVIQVTPTIPPPPSFILPKSQYELPSPIQKNPIMPTPISNSPPRITSRAFLDGEGDMNLWVSYLYSDLIHFAMNKATYDFYMNETQPFIE